MSSTRIEASEETREATRIETRKEALNKLIDIVLKPNAYEYVRMNRAIVQPYLENRSLLNARDDEGNAVLHYAANDGSLKMAKLLLESGADVDRLTKTKETPLMIAIMRFGNQDFKEALAWVQLFLDNGCDLSLRDQHGKTATEYLMDIFMQTVQCMPSSKLEQWASSIDFKPLITLVLLTPRSVLDYGYQYKNSDDIENYNNDADAGVDVDPDAAPDADEYEDNEYDYRHSLHYHFRDFDFRVRLYRLSENAPALDKVITDLVQVISPVSEFEVRALIQRGEVLPVMRYVQDTDDYRTVVDEQGNDLLMEAVISGHLPIVCYLVKHNFSLSVFNDRGRSALMLAVENKRYNILKYLLTLATEKDLCAYKYKDITLLTVAEAQGDALMGECVLNALLTPKKQTSIFFNLIDNGVVSAVSDYLETERVMDISRQELYQKRSLANSMFHRMRLSAVGRSTRFIDERDAAGKTALHRLVACHHYRKVRSQFPSRLLGGQLKLVAGWNGAALNAYFSMVTLLIQHGIHLHAVDKRGNTALMDSAKNPNYIITGDLIKRGIKVDIENSDGETALMIAARAGYVETVRILIKSGADIYKENKEGKTAFDLAKNTAVQDLLKSMLDKTYHERDEGDASASKRVKR